MRTDAAAEIKERLTAARVAELYGFPPGRGGFIRCPFHAGDDHGSLKLYPGSKGWHCFGCGAGGSVIDFVMRLFGISFRQAVVRIDIDFGLGLDMTGRRGASAERSALMEARRLEAQEKADAEDRYREIAREYRYWWDCKKYFAPSFAAAASQLHPLYAEAIKRLPVLQYMLDQAEQRIGR